MKSSHFDLYCLYSNTNTYKVGTVSNSCSTMHKIAEKEFTFDDFSVEQLLGREDDPFTVPVSSDGTKLSPLGLMLDVVTMLNGCRAKYLETKDKKYWWQMIQLLQSSYNQTRNVMMNYEVLTNIYKSRKNHKLDEWRDFCKWIETLPYSELICGEDNRPMTPNEMREFCGKDDGSMTLDKTNTIVDNSRGTGLWQPGDEF